MAITNKTFGKMVAGDMEIIAASAGSPNGTGVSAIEETGKIHTTVINLSSTAITMTDNEEKLHGGQKIYDLPSGSILVLGATADLNITVSDELEATANGDFGLGSAVADSDAALDSADQNIIPSTAIVCSGSAATLTGRNAAAIAPLDGTTTAIDIYLNFVWDDDAYTGEGGIVTVTGTITLAWTSLGDY